MLSDGRFERLLPFMNQIDQFQFLKKKSFEYFLFFASANKAICNLPTLIALASHYFAACVFCPQMFRCGQLWSLFMFSQHIVSSC